MFCFSLWKCVFKTIDISWWKSDKPQLFECIGITLGNLSKLDQCGWNWNNSCNKCDLLLISEDYVCVSKNSDVAISFISKLKSLITQKCLYWTCTCLMFSQQY